MTEEITLTGTVERYLLHGPFADDFRIILEFENARLIAAYNADTETEIPLSDIHQEDFEAALESLIEQIRYYAND